MGRSRVIPYTIKITTSDGAISTPSEWRLRSVRGCPADGKPTVENISRWVERYEASLRAGGTNAHLGIHSVVTAVVRHHGDVVCSWSNKVNRPNAPLFQMV
jgi:hypothetical protein